MPSSTGRPRRCRRVASFAASSAAAESNGALSGNGSTGPLADLAAETLPVSHQVALEAYALPASSSRPPVVWASRCSRPTIAF